MDMAYENPHVDDETGSIIFGSIDFVDGTGATFSVQNRPCDCVRNLRGSLINIT